MKATMIKLLRECVRRKSANRSAMRNAAFEGSDGTRMAWATMATVTRIPVAMNDARHDARLAMNVPNGTPITVANVTPARIIAVARAASRGCTSLPAAASARVQKPPRLAPRMARPISMTAKLGANADIRLDVSSNTESMSRI